MGPRTIGSSIILVAAAAVALPRPGLGYVPAPTESQKDNDSRLPSDCGRFLSNKFFIGNQTEIYDYPWLVLLEYDTPKGKRDSCGGVLISSRHVLTAAHCVANLSANWNLTSVRVGEYDTANQPDCVPEGNANGETVCLPVARSIRIAERTVHEEYGHVPGRNLALLRLAESATSVSSHVAPLCLPLVPSSLAQQAYHVAGWGRLAGRPGSTVKLRSRLSQLNGTSCSGWFGAEGVQLTQDEMCAGGRRSERPCIADSGGPLMGLELAPDGTHRMAVFGILAMDSRFCELKSWPGLFTRVLPYRDWIIDHLDH